MSSALASDAVKPWRRLAAGLIDVLLLLPLHGLLQAVLTEHLALTVLVVFALIAALISWRWFGATPGMALMDATLISSATEKKPALPRLILRMFGFVLALLPLGIGLLWILKGPHYQGWHDKLSGTAVIKDDEGRKTLAQLEEEIR